MEGITQTVSSRPEPAGLVQLVQSHVQQSSEYDEDEKDSAGDATILDRWASVKDDSAAATNTTATSISKLRSAATSRRTPKQELLNQKLVQFARPPTYRNPRRGLPSRQQQPPRKRTRISFKLGDITPNLPGTSCTPAGTLQDLGTRDFLQQQHVAPAHTDPSQTLNKPRVAATLSLTSLICSPTAPAGDSGVVHIGCNPWSCGAPSHGVYVAPTRQPPTAAGRAASRAALPTAAPQRPAAAPAAPFRPPADMEEVPEIVRMDRAVINTMQVSRRTSSRCVAPYPPPPLS